MTARTLGDIEFSKKRPGGHFFENSLGRSCVSARTLGDIEVSKKLSGGHFFDN